VSRLPPGAERCAPAARRRGDEMLGTAAPVPRWLLLEEHGPWGRNAVLESGLDTEAARSLTARAAMARVRVILIRRTGRSERANVRKLAWVDSRPGHEAIWWGTWSSAEDLMAVQPDRPAGDLSTEAAYLVCAHGRHDTCCAVYGRPVAAALAAIRPEATWECSHVGGDRFAPNVITLPHGLYYGQLEPADAADLVQRQESGRLIPELLRGRSAFTAPAQAAQHYARQALGEDRIDVLGPSRVDTLAPGRWRVRLAHPDGPVVVTLAARRSAEVMRLTCESRSLEHAREYALLDLVTPSGDS
jgi:hypothetical protein